MSGTGNKPARGLTGAIGYENALLAVLCVTFGALFWNRMALNFVLPQVAADFQLSNTETGLLVSILSLTWALSGFVVGAIADKTGKRKYLLVALTVGFSVTALFSGMVSGFLSLLIARLAMGLAQGPVLPLAQAVIARDSTPARRGLNMGLLQNLGSGLLANIIAPIAVVAMAVAWGWREALIASAIPGLLLAVVLVMVMRPDPPREPGAQGGGLSRISDSNIWLCLVGTCLMVMWLFIQMTFLPVFMVGTLQFSEADMALQMSIRGISGLAAGIVMPAISDRLGRKPVVIAGALLASLSPFWVAFPDQTFTSMALSGLLMGVGAGCMPMLMAIIPSETVPPAAAGATLGLIMGVGELVGGFGAPLAAGFLADAIGTTAPFLMAGTAAVVAGLLGIGLRETAGRRMREVAT